MIELDWKPGSRQLRQFAALALLVFGGLGAWLLHRGGASPLVGVLFAAAALIGLPGLVRPQSIRLAFVLASLVVLPIGLVLSHAILLFIFYGVITPTGGLMRLARRDTLRIRKRRPADGGWVPKRRPTSVESYLRQS